MKLPLAPSGISTMAAIWDWLRALSSAIATGWNVEHKSDGTHRWEFARPTFDANRFQGDGTIAWGVDAADVAEERYAVQGNLLCWTFAIDGTDTTGTASTELRLALPNGYIAARESNHAVAYCRDAGADRDAFITLRRGQRYASIRRRDLGNWTLTTADNTSIYASVWTEIQ